MNDILRIGVVIVAAVLATAPARAQPRADDGGDVYAQHCAPCHGERLNATGAAPDLKLLSAEQKAHFDEIVHNGKGQMPAWDGMLTDEEIGQVWAYVRSRAAK